MAYDAEVDAPAPALSPLQERLVESLRRDGIAVVPFAELVDGRWDDLYDDFMRFARETESRIEDYQQRTHGKTYIVRRFLMKVDGGKKRFKFSAADRWLRLGVSDEILGVVNGYHGPRQLIDLDNWYTIPDPGAGERIESQRWHRDGGNNHVVKVFVYFSDVDDGAGPFEYVRGSAAGGRYGDLWPWEPKSLYPPPEEFDAAIPLEDRLTVTGPAGTIIFCDTSGFHCGGFARTKPRLLSYHTYVTPPPGKQPRFKVNWSRDGDGLSQQARFALAWSVKHRD